MAVMKWFTLLNAVKETETTVSGFWVQDFFGTLEKAQEFAKETEEANSNKIKVRVVDCVNHPCAIGTFWDNRKKAVPEE